MTPSPPLVERKDHVTAHSHRPRCEWSRLSPTAITCGLSGDEDRDGTPLCIDHADLYDQAHDF